VYVQKGAWYIAFSRPRSLRHSSFGAAKRERLTRVLVRDGVDVLAVAIKTALHDATTKLDFAIGIVEINN
jgi:hypothetical protein